MQTHCVIILPTGPLCEVRPCGSMHGSQHGQPLGPFNTQAMPYKAFLHGQSQAQVFDLYKTSHAVHQQGSPRTRIRYRPSRQSRSRSPQAAPSGALAQLHDSSSAATYSCKCPKSSNPSPFPTEPPRNLKLTYIFWSRDRSADVVRPSGSPATCTQPGCSHHCWLHM